MPFPWFTSLHQGGMSYYGCLPFWPKYLSLTRDIFLYLEYILKNIKYSKSILAQSVKEACCALYDLDLDCDDFEEQIEHIDELRSAIKKKIQEVYSNIESLSGARIPDVSG